MSHLLAVDAPEGRQNGCRGRRSETTPACSAQGDVRQVPGATFDGLLTMLAQQHHREVNQLRAELKELPLVRQKNAALRRAFRAQTHGGGAAKEEQQGGEAAQEQEIDCKAAADRESRDKAAAAQKATVRVDAACKLTGVLPGNVPSLLLSPRQDDCMPRRASWPLGPLGAPSPTHAPDEQEDKDTSPTSPNKVVRRLSVDSAASVDSVCSVAIHDFRLLESWNSPADETRDGGSQQPFSWSVGDLAAHPFAQSRQPSMLSLSEPSQLSRWMAQPTSVSRLIWDFVGALLIFYDLFSLPMLLTFRSNEKETAFSTGMDWLILMFWTANVGASLTVGYLDHGLLVLSPRKILLRYLKTWFIVDILVLVPDWIFTIASLQHNAKEEDMSESGTRFLRVVRLIRIVRIVRLLKLRRIFDTLNDMITSEYVSVMANIMTMILILLVINHQFSCAWYWVAEHAQDGGKIRSWTSEFRLFHEDEYGYRPTWVYMYATSFHWSIAQFTPATVDVSPKCLVERIFAIIVVIFAVVGFSYMVGSITGSLAQLRNMHVEESNLFWDLRRYMAKNKVSATLSIRIQKYLEHAWRHQQDKKPAKSTQLMSLLSEQLFSELQCELAVAQLQVHPFLAELCEKSSVTVQRLANAAFSHKLYASGDYLFHPGEAATHLWIVVEGSYEYSRVDTSGNLHKEVVDSKQDWIAEPVLWTKWAHRGLLTALEDGNDLAIDGSKFCELVCLNPQAHAFASRYARNFMEWLNSQGRDNLSDISQGEDVIELVKGFMCEDGNDDGDDCDSTDLR